MSEAERIVAAMVERVSTWRERHLVDRDAVVELLEDLANIVPQQTRPLLRAVAEEVSRSSES